MYAQDYDECLPGYIYAAGTTPRLYWFDVLAPYIKNQQILTCPSAANVTPTGYGWNFRWMSYGWVEAVQSCTAMGAIAYPSETVLLSDSNQYYVRGPGTTLTSYWPPARHNGGANFGLADGHAKWYQADQFQNSPGPLKWTAGGTPY